MSVSNHILDTQVLGSDKGKTNTVRWLQGYVANRRSVGSPDFPSRSMCSGACSQATMKRTDSDRICGCGLFSAGCFPKNCPPLHTPCLDHVADLHWSRGCHDQADSFNVGNRGASGPGQHVGGRVRVMLMEGTYIGRVSGEVLISGGGQTAKADNPVCVQST